MLCANCSGEIKNDETITSPTINLRQKRCQVCGFKFYTKEIICEPEEAEPLFKEWTRERSRKARAKKKGLVYEPTAKGNNQQGITPKLPTRPLF